MDQPNTDQDDNIMNYYISQTHPSPLKQLGSRLRNVAWWTSRNKNTNRNSCSYYQPRYVPGGDACCPPGCPKPMINVRCDRGGWLDDLRRMGIINFVGDILSLITFIFVMLAIAEYFFCPKLKPKGSVETPYFFCSTCDNAPPPPPPEEPEAEEPPEGTYHTKSVTAVIVVEREWNLFPMNQRKKKRSQRRSQKNRLTRKNLKSKKNRRHRLHHHHHRRRHCLHRHHIQTKSHRRRLHHHRRRRRRRRHRHHYQSKSHRRRLHHNRHRHHYQTKSHRCRLHHHHHHRRHHDQRRHHQSKIQMMMQSVEKWMMQMMWIMWMMWMRHIRKMRRIRKISAIQRHQMMIKK